ncbi:ribosomal large subunit pseudouridine synthase D [Marinitoga hydrogenitolerans DSM 16785]|uniref:Pseudouridine synthase n=1 Tax=Marinitoga hydrogenitolerans (strain DSM 16785 / JCM 12826 / AT1271) TaxID=1122195 RepID=A0A1M4WZ99_MARH1|nr:RluA family pseudouridine synthase [Marinitoga hydrogenitolerans]SHE86534.1 ribosomal large subunit pseudouridine synthase D [Marinitoga hydrogenitolerans DSM 16785]
MEENFLVTSRENGWRLDKFVVEKVPDWISRNYVQKAIKHGQIIVNGNLKKPSYKVKNNDIVSIEVPDNPPKIEVLPEKIPLNIIYEDKDIIVVNKPPFMIVHPVFNKVTGTLVNALLYHCKDLQGIGGEIRPGIVHRLDKNTSGAIVVAKNDLAHQSLSKQFKNRKTKKTYIALIKGTMKRKNGEINEPIGRHPQIRIKMAVVPDGKESVTLYKIIKEFGNKASLAWINLKTGRTHQIRVHFKYMGHPLLGDEVYGNPTEDFKYGIRRQMLHALKLGLYHPRTNEWKEFVAPLPEDFKEAIINLNNE